MPHNSSIFTPEIIDQLVKETMPLGYIVWDTEGHGIDCSVSVAEMFGLKTAQEVFDNWENLSPSMQPSGLPSGIYFREVVALANVKGKIVFEWDHKTIDDKPLPTEVTVLRHNINDKGYLIAYLHDLRALKKSRHEENIGEYWFTSILRSCPICFAVLSADRFTFVTPFMHNFLGVSVGDTFSSLATDPGAAEMLNYELQENEIVSWIPITVRTQYGEIKEMLAYMLCFDGFAEDQEVIVWLIDVTQSRRLERELQTAKDTAEANTRAKSEFLANMSHEIRTPMNAIIGLTHLALRTSLTEQQTEYIDTVQQSAHILLRLINDILDFSKIEAGRMILEYQEFSIESIISELTAVVSPLIQKKKLDFQVNADKSLPPTIMGDFVRLHQVVLNLLTNAIKFTEQGTIRLDIKVVELDVLSITVRFSVTDSGIGMTPTQMSGLFQPFSQATASTTRLFGGTGLGLAIAKQIVELMHGDIQCQSNRGEGTTFTFTARFGIPLEGEIVSVDESTEVRINALLVGDCPQDQAAMRHYIELLSAAVHQIGAELTEFKATLDTRKIERIDFIIFDFSDLEKDFVPIYRAMQERQLNPMPMCIVTEHPDLNSVLDKLGINDSVIILKKPVDAEDLFNIIARVNAYKEELRFKKKRADEQSSPHGKENIGIPHSIRGAKILLVEDNKINQMVAQELLKVEGFETTVAENGRIALEILETQKFDLVLMDVQMPVMDGFEATKAIREDERFRNIPVLAMTANAMAGARELSLESGMNDHIAKPIEPKVLYSALAKWIRK